MFFVIIRRPPTSTLTHSLFPDPTRFRSDPAVSEQDVDQRRVECAGHGLGDPVEHGAEYRLAAIQREPVFRRSEEHTSELQSLMRISYAVFCLKKKNNTVNHNRMNCTNTITRQQQ